VLGEAENRRMKSTLNLSPRTPCELVTTVNITGTFLYDLCLNFSFPVIQKFWDFSFSVIHICVDFSFPVHHICSFFSFLPYVLPALLQTMFTGTYPTVLARSLHGYFLGPAVHQSIYNQRFSMNIEKVTRQATSLFIIQSSI
jgi:hypothetical protein